MKGQWNDGARGRRPTADCSDNVWYFASSEDGVDFGNFLPELVAVALCKTTGHDEPLTVALRLVPRHLEDRVDRFLLRRVDESAGIDDDDVRTRRIRREVVAGVARKPEHYFRVDEILGTPERDETDFHFCN